VTPRVPRGVDGTQGSSDVVRSLVDGSERRRRATRAGSRSRARQEDRRFAHVACDVTNLLRRERPPTSASGVRAKRRREAAMRDAVDRATRGVAVAPQREPRVRRAR